MFALVALVGSAIPAMVQAEQSETKGKLFIRELVNIESDDRKEMNRLAHLLGDDKELTKEEIRDIKEQRKALKEKSKKITPKLSDEKKLEIRGHIDELGDVMNKLYSDGTVPIVAVGTYAEDKSVQIRILKDGLTEDKILQYEKEIRKIIGNKINITIIPSEPARLTTCSQTGDCNPLEAGAEIGIGFKTCSMGFRASYDNKTGFVTAGHCNSGNIGGTGDDVGQPTGFFWDKIGTVHANAFVNNTWCDCMFVDTTETISSDVFSNVALNNVLYPSIDDYIYAEGRTTQGEGGQITDTYQHFTVEFMGDNYTIKGAVQIDFTSAGGDSGGPVYEDVSSGTPRFAGILTGNLDGYGYYIPHYRITNEFSGLTFTYS